MILGIDFSSHNIDLVQLDEDTNHATHQQIPLYGPDAFDRARTVRTEMPTRTSWIDNGCIAIGIEDPRGPQRRADSVLYRVQGAILACLPEHILVQPWKPGEWRKQIGVAHIGKQPAAAFALERWANIPDSVSQDACDAFCIAWATRARILVEAIA